MRKLLFLFIGLTLFTKTFAQDSPFQITLEPLAIQDLPGVHSFAFGQANGQWLLVGGRVDGLHRRQPFAAFDSLGNNYGLTAVDPDPGQVWASDLLSLPATIQEHLSATNPEFYQVGKMLYVIGGYGYSPSMGDHVTYDFVTAIDLPATIQAIRNKGDLKPYFRQISDPKFAITGGQLERIQDVFYLIGGHTFGGRYNPNGPDFGPGFSQQYNHEILAFKLEDDANALSIFHYPGPIDSVHLHRRDYNLSPQIMPNGQDGLLALSGVFQYKADIPYLNIVEVEGNGYRVVPGFQQHYQQYHCAKLPFYSAQSGEMHTLLCGGIGEYYDSAGVHVIDCNVPFTKAISRITRNAKGQYHEYLLPIEMPNYLGASAEFIRVPTLPQYENGVVKLDELPAEKSLLGYIVGGIHSSDDNIFWANEGEHSTASSTIYKVYLSKSPTAPADFLNTQGISPLQLEVLPDPYRGLLLLDFQMVEAGTATIDLVDAKGKKVLHSTQADLSAGPQHLELKCKRLKKGGRFFLTLTAPKDTLKLKIIVEL